MSGVLARFPWLLPVRNPVAGYTEPLPESAAAKKKSEAAAKRDQSKKRRRDKNEAHIRDTIAVFGARKKRRKTGCGAQQPLPVKREPVVEESSLPYAENLVSGDLLGACGVRVRSGRSCVRGAQVRRGCATGI